MLYLRLVDLKLNYLRHVHLRHVFLSLVCARHAAVSCVGVHSFEFSALSACVCWLNQDQEQEGNCRVLARPKNTADARNVSKALRAEVSTLVAADFLHTNMDMVAKSYSQAMLAVLKLTSRPTKKVLQKASALAFPGDTGEETVAFGKDMYKAFAHCQAKAKSSISEKKLPREVWRVAQAVQRGNRPHLPKAFKSRLSALPKSKAKLPSLAQRRVTRLLTRQWPQ